MNPLIGSPLPAPQRLGHAPHPCPTRVRRVRRAGRKARSHCCWEGGAEFSGSWKAREKLFPAARPYERSPAGGTGSAPLPGHAFFSCQYPSPTQLFCSDLSRRFPLLSEGVLLLLPPFAPRSPAFSGPATASPGSLRQFPISRRGSALKLLLGGGARVRRPSPHGAPARLGLCRTTFPSRRSG